MIVLANVIRKPEDDLAYSDMELIKPLLRLLDLLAENKNAKQMDGIRMTCEKVAKAALQKAASRALLS